MTSTELYHSIKDIIEKKAKTRQVLTHLIGAIPTAVLPLCDLLKHPHPEAQVAAALMLDQLLDPRSIDAFIDAMGQPAVREIAVGTLKKLSAIRERIDATFNALREHTRTCTCMYTYVYVHMHMQIYMCL